YVQLEDAYKSLREALLHGGLAHNHKTSLDWVEAEDIDSPETATRRLHGYDGILVPGGFGKRGIQGMVYAIQYAREHKVPFFGICLGMQCATIEYARDVAGLKQADSTEFDPQTPYRVIYKLRELLGVDEMGGTMRLGAWPCKLEPGSFAHKAYGKLGISERHRHRYEFNRDFVAMAVAFADSQLAVSLVREGSWLEFARPRTQPHRATHFVHSQQFAQFVNHTVRRLRIELRAVRLFQAGHVARIFDCRALHPQANPEERHFVLARVLNGVNHSLNSALAEPPGHENSVVAVQPPRCRFR